MTVNDPFGRHVVEVVHIFIHSSIAIRTEFVVGTNNEFLPTLTFNFV